MPTKYRERATSWGRGLLSDPIRNNGGELPVGRTSDTPTNSSATGRAWYAMAYKQRVVLSR